MCTVVVMVMMLMMSVMMMMVMVSAPILFLTIKRISSHGNISGLLFSLIHFKTSFVVRMKDGALSILVAMTSLVVLTTVYALGSTRWIRRDSRGALMAMLLLLLSHLGRVARCSGRWVSRFNNNISNFQNFEIELKLIWHNFNSIIVD